jgi:hypothetical protein
MVFIGSAIGSKATEKPLTVVDLHTNGCVNSTAHQPNGPFVVMIFCEKGFGFYIAVICYDPGSCENIRTPSGVTNFKAWSYSNRIWQEPLWASDVDSFAWLPDGMGLVVATRPEYGSGGIFSLGHLEQSCVFDISG